MNEVIAANIRQYREHLSWTQEQLAEAARLNVRTVQRAEEGRGMSAETLSAIAGAFDVSLDNLRTDPMEFLAKLLGVEPSEVTPELIASKIDEAKAKYATVPLTIAESSSDLHILFEAGAFFFDCTSSDDDVQDVAAELQQWVGDLLDISGELGPLQKRQYVKEAFGVVERLGELGYSVSVGLHRHGLRLENGQSMAWCTLYTIVSPSSEVKKFAMVEKNTAVRFKL